MKRKILAWLSFTLARLLYKTLSVEVIMHPDYQFSKQYLYAFWHGKQFIGFFSMINHAEKRAILVSPSRDGDIVTHWLQKLGFLVLRGSSRKNNVSALLSLIKILKKGFSIGFAVDGPIGPLHKVKPGITHLAQKLDVPIIPMGSYYSKKWRFDKAWDKYEIPKPFSKARIYLGQPYQVDKTMALEACNETLEKKIHEAETLAKF